MSKDYDLRERMAHLEELVEASSAAVTELQAQLRQVAIEREQADGERRHLLAEAELRTYQEHLEQRVQERTAELRKSEERYRSLFDGVPVGMYRTTPQGQVVDANLALVQMLGFQDREEALASNTANLYIDPQDRARWQALMEEEGVVRDFEVRHRRFDGSVFWVSDTARAVKDDQGRVLFYEGSLEDITERKTAEEELRRHQEHLEELVAERTAELKESEARYRTLFDGVPVGLYRSTPDGHLLDVNQAFVQLMGYADRESMLAINTSEFYADPQEQVRWRALMEQEGVVRDYEGSARRPDGTVGWYSESSRAVRDEKGEVLYYEGSVEEITERKAYEEEIRRQKEYFEALFLNIPVAAFTADRNACVLSWNPMAERLLGYSQEEAIGQNVDDLVATDPSVREHALASTKQVMVGGYVHATTKRTRKDGTLVDVELRGVPVMMGDELTGYIVIYHDISELQEARRSAEAANQAKSAFLANMSHELRTPLNAIMGFAQLMNNDPNLTAEQQQNLGIINRSGEHLLDLINDVLEMSKIEAGRVTLQEQGFNLHRLLETLEEVFRLRAGQRGLILTLECADDVPPYVRADEGKVRQVLTNLLGNAVKFTEEGTVGLRVGWDADTERLAFEVRDTGPGIAPEDTEAVFEPFVQAAGGERTAQGTGLGLTISRQFARLMGGDITVRSRVAQGSVFRFELPIDLAEAADIDERGPSYQVIGLAPGTPTCRLLVVDDRETTRDLLIKLLGPLGFEVHQAADGQEAIEVWEEVSPHLIWMDMRMPVMDGYEATRKIKAEMEGQETIIIALTASAFEEDRETILAAGCDDMVRKPFRQEEIFEMLSKHLGIRFVCEEDESSRPAADMSTDVPQGLTPEALAELPSDWLEDLQQATIRADLEKILALVDQVSVHNPGVAENLEILAQGFQYERILAAIAEAGEQP